VRNEKERVCSVCL